VDEAGEPNIMGIVRLSKLHGTNEARLSILIGDPYQGIGLGGELVRRAVDIARQERLSRLSSILTSDNQVMQHIFEKLGFRIEPLEDGKLTLATIDL
jgi:acetyltransferase